MDISSNGTNQNGVPSVQGYEEQRYFYDYSCQKDITQNLPWVILR